MGVLSKLSSGMDVLETSNRLSSFSMSSIKKIKTNRRRLKTIDFEKQIVFKHILVALISKW